jgi:putative transposase
MPVVNEKGVATGKSYFLPSAKWRKYHKTLRRALHKRREQTKTFMFTGAHHLFKRYDCVAIGDYTPSGGGITSSRRRAMNNRSLHRRFKEILSWVALKSGKTFIEYDEAGTTRTCNACLEVEREGIPVLLRMWECKHCKAMHIRDENAAINRLKVVLRDLLKKEEREYPFLVSGSDRGFVKKR